MHILEKVVIHLYIPKLEKICLAPFARNRLGRVWNGALCRDGVVEVVLMLAVLRCCRETRMAISISFNMSLDNFQGGHSRATLPSLAKWECQIWVLHIYYRLPLWAVAPIQGTAKDPLLEIEQENCTWNGFSTFRWLLQSDGRQSAVICTAWSHPFLCNLPKRAGGNHISH